MSKIKVCVGIVIYNPDIDRLVQNIDHIIDQVDSVLLINNASENFDFIERRAGAKERLYIINNNENMGIAYALNQIYDWASDHHYVWALTLDQDSICPPNMIEELMEYADENNVGMICSRFRNITEVGTRNKVTSKYEDIDMCITSGSMLLLSAWNKTEKIESWMFIDCVDYDICLKLRRLGFRIIRNNNVVLDHCVGNAKVVSFFGKKITVYNHNDQRNYYFVRNYTYIIRKYYDIVKPMKRILYVLQWELVKIIFEPHKIKTLKSAIRGYIDGMKIKID